MPDAPLANEIVASEIKPLAELSGELDILLIGSQCCDRSLKEKTHTLLSPEKHFPVHFFFKLSGGGGGDLSPMHL